MNKRTRDSGSANDDARRRQKSADIAAAVIERIRNGDPEELLDELCARWELDVGNAASLEDFTRLAMTNFGVPPSQDINLGDPQRYGLPQLDETIERHEQEAVAVYSAVRLHDPAGERPELHQRAKAVIEMVYYAKRLVLSAFQARLAVHNLHCAEHTLAPELDALLRSWTLRFGWVDLSKSTPLQKLLLFLLDTAMEKGYRKQGDHVYEQVLSPEGHATHAWRLVPELGKTSTIADFVHKSIQKEANFEQWSNLLASGNNAKMAVEHLKNCVDYQFRFLVKDRTKFSFRNGLYDAEARAFHPYATSPLPDTVVAAKYFDLHFDPHEGTDDWRDIPTPSLHRIMEFQRWSPEVCDWMYVCLGRLLYSVGAKDGWQIIPFLHGSASSGKSTITLKVAKLFYEHTDVGVLSNNIEKQFGISAFFAKLLFVGPEIKSDLKVEQAEFQSIVSGETVQVNAKHKTAFPVEWDVPGILAGNEAPAFSDNAGSVQRRFLVFAFERAVVNGDMGLAKKLEEELAAILLKCNRAYREAADRWGTRNVWTVLPAYFHGTRNEMAQAVNSIEAFLASTEVVLGAELYCPYKEFRDAWKSFSIHNGYTQQQNKPITAKLFLVPFEKYGLRIENACVREYGGRSQKAQWVVGVDLAAAEGAAAALG